MDSLSDKIKKNFSFVSVDIGSYSTKSLSSNFILNKTFENQIDSATRFQLYDIPINNIYIKDYNKDVNQDNEKASNSTLNKRDEIIKYDYLNIRPKCLMDKIKLYNVNYSNNPTYYDDIEDDESCTSGVCIDKSTGFLGYKIKPANQKNTYFISYDYLLQRYVDLYINELLEKMNPRGQNKKLILIFTIPLFEDDSKKLSKNESFKYYNNLTRKRYIDNINKGLSKYKEDILGVVYMTEIEGLIYHWKNIYESKLLQKIKCDPNRRQNLEYQKKVLFIDFGCYYTRYYFVNIYSINNKNNKNNENDNDYEILEWDVLNIAGEMINEGIIQLLLKKYPEIKKGYSKILGKYKIWRTVDQEIKRAFTNSNLKDFSCEILSSGDYYDCMINRNEINTILHPYCEILINTIKNISSKYNINQR